MNTDGNEANANPATVSYFQMEKKNKGSMHLLKGDFVSDSGSFFAKLWLSCTHCAAYIDTQGNCK